MVDDIDICFNSRILYGKVYYNGKSSIVLQNELGMLSYLKIQIIEDILLCRYFL